MNDHSHWPTLPLPRPPKNNRNKSDDALLPAPSSGIGGVLRIRSVPSCTRASNGFDLTNNGD